MVLNHKRHWEAERNVKGNYCETTKIGPNLSKQFNIPNIELKHYLCSPFFRQLLLCRVALGKSFLQYSAMKMAHAPPGHHSVIGRPSAGGLHFTEYVVYRGEQVSKLNLS